MPGTLPSFVYPGSPLGPSPPNFPGPGTHFHASTSAIHASLSGKPATKPLPTNNQHEISIPRPLPSVELANVMGERITNTNVLPRVGDVVLARVSRVRVRQVDVVIQVVYPGDTEGGEGCVCADDWAAVIRKEDVRATEKEKVVCADGFRVGDVVRGVVISLGDQSNFYLTTGKNELGVIMARSEAGNAMYPISWKEFQDQETGVIELRKVAKPF